ncbi:MAG: WD40 repeat domain-containing protein [Propionibacteriaceae bacterium]|jgi:hypothetical protein|nr:WD40 repeat domain-containing protein [Propionibacteriaceae bacterium]
MPDPGVAPDPDSRFFPLVVAEYTDPSLRQENLSPETVERAVRQAEAFAAAFGHQTSVPLPPLEPAQTTKQTLLERLSNPTVGPVSAPPSPPTNPPSRPITDPGHGGTGTADRRIIFTYWLGHGRESVEGKSVLFASNSRVAGLEKPDDAIYSDDFAGHFKDQAQRPDILPVLLLDACGGHQFILDVKAKLERRLNYAADAANPPAGRDYILIAARSSQGSTFPGRTAEKLLDAIDLSFSLNDRIEIDSLARTAEKMKPPLAFEYNSHQLVLTRPAPPPGMTVTEQADWRAAIARLKRDSPDAARFFLPKGGWGERAGELTWDFVGREAERGRVARWLETGRGLLVVTGEPGAGKSALLGDVIMRSDSMILRAIVKEGLAEKSDHDEALARHAPSATLNLIGRTAKDTAEQLGRQAFHEHWIQDCDSRHTTDSPERPTGGRDRPAEPGATAGPEPPAVDEGPDDSVKRLLTIARNHSSPLSFVVDGLDESAEPYLLATELLAPLAALPGVAVIVGTRRSVHSRLNAEVADYGLLRALGAVTDPTTPAPGQNQVLDLPRSPGTMASYLKARLRRRLTATPPDLIDQTVKQVVAVADQPFLYARLAASKIESEKDPTAFMAAVNHDLPGALGQDCATAFRRALDQIQASAPANRFILLALALSQGRGLPEIDTIWSTVARALGAPVVEIAPDATSELFKSHARDYLIGDLDHSQTVYRFAHRTFAEAVLDELVSTAQPEEPDPTVPALVPGETVASAQTEAESPKATAESVTAAVAEAHATIAAALTEVAWQRLSQAADRGEPPDETTLNPYIAHYLPVHCALAGGEPWAAVEAHAPILDHLDPAQVANSVITRGFGSTPVQPQTAAVTYHGQLLRTLPAALDRRRVRELLAYHFGSHPAPPRLAVSADQFDCQVSWASMPQWNSHRRLDIGIPVNTVISVQGLLALGCADGTIRLWNPTNRQPWGQPLEGHQNTVRVLVTVTVNDQTLLASGGGDWTIRLWDPVTGQPWGQPLEGHQDTVRALAAVTVNDQTLLASGGTDWTIRLWNTVTGQPWGQPLEGHRNWVMALTAVTVNGRTLLASGGDDRTIRLWNLTSGKPWGQPLKGHQNWVRVLAPITVGDLTLLASGSTDRTIRLWDTVTGQPWGQPLEGHQGIVRALTAVTVNDQTLLASGGDDGVLALWDLDNPQSHISLPLGGPITGLVPLSSGHLAVKSDGGFAVYALTGDLPSKPTAEPVTID